MAEYRAETKCITRSKNHNAVAAAAYRAGQKLTDTNEFNDDARTHDYSKKGGVLSADIVLPKFLEEAYFTISRQELWSHVEQHEITKADNSLKRNARVAREWLLSLPHELSDDENKELALEFAQRLANDLGVIADCCIHKPVPKTPTVIAEKDDNDQQGDPRNIHAHIMFTTRKAHLCDDNTLMFGSKADSELSGQARLKKGLVKETDYLKQVREVWADMVNERLAKHGHNLVDHRSYTERGIDILPQVHLGTYLSELENNGEETQRGNYNRDIIQRNELVFKRRADTLNSLANQADATSTKTEQYLRSGDSAAEWTADQTRAVSKRLEYGKHQAIEVSQAIERRSSTTTDRPNPFDDKARRARVAKLDEQQGRADRNARSYSYTDESTAKSIERLKIHLAMKLLSRHDANNALQNHEDIAQNPQKFDSRQIQELDKFAQTIGATEPITDFREDSKRISGLFTDEIVMENINIIHILKNTLRERDQYDSKTSKFEQQKIFDDHTVGNSENINKASYKSNDSLLEHTTKYKPR